MNDVVRIFNSKISVRVRVNVKRDTPLEPPLSLGTLRTWFSLLLTDGRITCYPGAALNDDQLVRPAAEIDDLFCQRNEYVEVARLTQTAAEASTGQSRLAALMVSRTLHSEATFFLGNWLQSADELAQLPTRDVAFAIACQVISQAPGFRQTNPAYLGGVHDYVAASPNPAHRLACAPHLKKTGVPHLVALANQIEMAAVARCTPEEEVRRRRPECL